MRSAALGEEGLERSVVGTADLYEMHRKAGSKLMARTCRLRVIIVRCWTARMWTR